MIQLHVHTTNDIATCTYERDYGNMYIQRLVYKQKNLIRKHAYMYIQ